MTLDQLKEQLTMLSPEERAELALYLLRSLDDGEDEGAEAAWDAELARRFAEIDSGKAVGIPAEDVLARLREKYP
jgi:putative addiction module component (TIGR02574 family)